MTSPTLNTAIAIARRAGEILMDVTGNRTADFKGEIDLVTEYDRRSEAYIVSALSQTFPDHALRAEEGSRVNSGAEYEWLIDPLDGTTNFAHGLPIFAVSIALLHHGEPVLGVVFDPSRNECFWAAKGEGAFLNGRPMAVSPTQPLSRSLLVTGFPYDIRTNPHNNLAQFNHFAVRAQAVRRLGSAALDLAYVACGRFEGYWEFRLNAWDIAAGVLLVREAGGWVTDHGGGAVAVPMAALIASNGLIHDEMLTVLRDGQGAPKP